MISEGKDKGHGMTAGSCRGGGKVGISRGQMCRIRKSGLRWWDWINCGGGIFLRWWNGVRASALDKIWPDGHGWRRCRHLRKLSWFLQSLYHDQAWQICWGGGPVRRFVN